VRVIAIIVAGICFMTAACHRAYHLKIEESDMSIEQFGLRMSNAHANLIQSALYLANGVLKLDTRYQLRLSTAVGSPTAIPVYVAFGKSLGDTEYSAAPAEIRCVLVNVALIPKLLESFHIKYDERGAQSVADPAVGLLALVLLHEVGHIFLRDGHTPGTNVDIAHLRTLAGRNRSSEVDADLFVGDRLRAARSIFEGSHLTHQHDLRETRYQEVQGAIALQILIDNIALKDLRSLRTRRMSVSHLDLDLRIYLLFSLSTRSPDLRGVEFAVDDRLQEDKYNRARGDFLGQVADCCASKYRVDLSLLRDPDAAVRGGAVASLKRIMPLPAELLPPLLDAITEKYGEVPGVGQLMTFFGKLAVPSLTRILSATSASPRVRENAVFTLAGMSPKDNVEAIPLLAGLLLDSDAIVQHWAKLALSEHGLCKTPEALEAVPGPADAGPPCTVKPERMREAMQALRH
jgi:hypothetical protein